MAKTITIDLDEYWKLKRKANDKASGISLIEYRRLQLEVKYVNEKSNKYKELLDIATNRNYTYYQNRQNDYVKDIFKNIEIFKEKRFASKSKFIKNVSEYIENYLDLEKSLNELKSELDKIRYS